MNIPRLSLVGTLGIWTLGALYACSSSDENSSDTNGSDGSAAAGDSSTTSDDSAATSDAAIANESGATDSGSVVTFADGGGVRLTDPTGTYDLTESPGASILGNAYAFGAASFAGGALRSVRMFARYGVISDSGAAEFVTPVVGKYTCGSSLTPTPGNPVLNSSGQYMIPGSVIFQSDGTSATECELDLTTFGPVGTRATGTFTAKFPQVGVPDASIQISGSFDVPRVN